MEAWREVAERAARVGGAILQSMRGRVRPREKSPRDFVTEADLASQAAIREVILGAFPDHAFVGEEDVGPVTSLDELLAKATRPCWIVDPLDGTANYIHGLQTYAVSIAVVLGREIVAGVVFDPASNECFWATAGGGAFLGPDRIRASDCRTVRDALLVASFPPKVEPGSDEVTRFLNVLYECHSLRRLGSAALNLAYLAAGRVDGYWAASVKAWDVAAGVLLAREAGAIVTRDDGTPFDLCQPRFVATATPPLHEELVRLLARTEPTSR